MKSILLSITIILAIVSISCSGDKTTNTNDTSQNTEVKISTQIWQTKNLDVTKYRNGDPIPEVTDSTEWIYLTMGAWCNYNNNPANGAIYGKLYNWYAVNDPRGLAPLGWHIPSMDEWTQLTNSLGGYQVCGLKMKEMGLDHWLSPNTGATNESGFTALPGGRRASMSLSGAFQYMGSNGFWWLSDSFFVGSYGRGFSLSYKDSAIGVGYNDKLYGFSVRLVKD